MKNKFLISTLMLLMFITLLCSQVFATTNMINSAGNTLMKAGNSIGNAAVKTKDTIVNGTENLANDVSNIGNDAMNDTNNTVSTLDTGDTNYTATRTATDTGLFGMSSTLATWLILGTVGAIIVGLVWYYNNQFEHRNYNND